MCRRHGGRHVAVAVSTSAQPWVYRAFGKNHEPACPSRTDYPQEKPYQPMPRTRTAPGRAGQVRRMTEACDVFAVARVAARLPLPPPAKAISRPIGLARAVGVSHKTRR